MDIETLTTGSRKTARVVSLLKTDIQQGKYPFGGLLPSETELAKDYRVSRVTLRKALTALAEKGNVIKLPHKGMMLPHEGSIAAGRLEAGIGAATQRKISVAAFWAGVPDYGVTKRLEGIRRYAEVHGLQFRNYLSSTNEETLATLEKVEDYGVEGVLVNPFLDTRYISVIKRLIEKKIPVVSFRGFKDLALNSIGSDDAVGAYNSVHYLIQKYKRPVHHITEMADADSCPERFWAYRSAMIDSGFGELVESHTWRMETTSGDPRYWPIEKKWVPGFETARRMLEKVEFPISVYAANDFVARGVYQAARERGLVIGKDVMVVGMDDLPLAAMLEPGLTTMKASIEEIGYEAAKLLHQILLKKVQPPIHIRLPLELVVRESA
jgi:DNA-binding LacI/PurR family transcriptional regulator